MYAYVNIYIHIFLCSCILKPYDDNLLNIFHRWMHIVKTNNKTCTIQLTYCIKAAELCWKIQAFSNVKPSVQLEVDMTTDDLAKVNKKA